MLYFHYDIIWLQIVVGLVLTTALGFVWYSPKIGFGKQWMQLVGLTEEDTNGPDMLRSLIINLVVSAIAVYPLAVLVNNITPTAASPTILAVFLWLISPFSIIADRVLWELKDCKLFFINSGYELVRLLMLSYALYYLKPTF